MKKIKATFSFLLFLIYSLYAQNWNAVLNINPFPSPYLSSLETNLGALGSVTIFNYTSESKNVIASGYLYHQTYGLVLTVTSNPIFVPATSSITIDRNNINISEAKFPQPNLKTQVLQTGRLPEGSYTFCLKVEDENHLILVDNICSNFTIVYPDPPHLIYPVDQDSISANILYPTFQWTPVVVPPNFQIKYTLKIVEVFPGQTPAQALSANYPHYINNQIDVTNFTYPIDGLQFEGDKRYAWQVQVLDQFGLPPTQNQGKSEIFTFVKKAFKPIVFISPINLLSPADNEFIKSYKPLFDWSFIPPLGTSVIYNLRVVRVLSGQSLETAIKNYPLLNQNIINTSFQPTQSLSLNATDTYAWQVVAINSQTNDTLQKSEIRTFRLNNLILLLPDDNSTVNVKRPTFQWAYYGGSHKYYDIKVIKLPMFFYNPGGTIPEELFNDPKNIIFQKYNIDGAALSNVNNPNLEVPVFKPDTDIPMEEGKTYYWQVTVKDQPFGNEIIKSEIRKIIFNPYQPGFATNSSISGTLHYEFAKPGEYLMWPLRNINVKLVIKYILKYTSHSGNVYGNYTSPQGEIELPLSALNVNYQSDYNKTVAIGKTDNEGKFSFSFWNGKQMGVIDDNFVFRGGGEFPYTYRGKLYRVIRLVVQSPYYTSPEKDIVGRDIIVQPGESHDYTLVAYVRSYSLTVTVKSPGSYWNHSQSLGANAVIPKMIVYLLRKSRPSEVPQNEGLPAPEDSTESPWGNSYQEGWRVIAKGVTSSDGKATFDRLVKSVYQQNDEYYIFVRPDSSKTTLMYQTWIPVSYKFSYPGDKAVYNSEYQYSSQSKEVVAFPLNPIVKGKIKRQDGGQPLENAQVKLMNYAIIGYTKESTKAPNPQPTNSNGEFIFDNLQNIYDGNGNATGPLRFLEISKYGYRDTSVVVNDFTVLLPGSSWSKEISLEPESKVIGKIVDENGNGVSAIVQILGGESKEVRISSIISPFGIPPVPFSLRAPKGPVKVIFDPIPFNSSYLKDTIDINITSYVYDMGTVVLKKALHRIKIFARVDLNNIKPPLPDAKVKLETWNGQGNLTLIEEKTADNNGLAEFIFSNPSQMYRVTVSSPPDKDFQTKQIIITNNESGDWKYYYVDLKQAAKVTGYVYVGNQNTPVPNAKVTIKGSSSGILPETYTDSTGYYILHNVPLGLHTLVASKKSSNLIGDEKNVFVVSSGLQNVNFNLKVYSDMDITHLLGFPIEVTTLKEQNGEILISGKFVDLDSLKNNIFSSTEAELNFTNISIIPDENLKSIIFGVEVPFAKPKVLPLKTDKNSLGVKVFDKYSGAIKDNKIGVELMTGQAGVGVIAGKIKILEGSFNISSQNLSFTSGGFYIKNLNTTDMKLPVITADKSSPLNTNKFQVVNESGENLVYKLYNFNADANKDNSFLYTDSLILHTTIHTDLQGVTPKDVNLNIGNVSIITSDTTSKIKPLLNQTSKVTLTLDQWTLEITKWSLSGAFTATSGVLKTNVVDIPLKNLYLMPKELTNVDFDFKTMSLGGVALLKVYGSTMFGYEAQGNKKWFLTVNKGSNQYAAAFGGLEGMEPNDSIYINSFSLYSDGTKNFSPKSTTITIYKVGSLVLDQIIVGNNSIEMRALRFKIPGLGNFSSAVQYFKENNQVKFKLVPVPIKFNTKGVELAFGTNANTEPEFLDNNGLRVRGRIKEEGKFDFIAWLYHTKDSTSIWVENPNLTTPPNSPPKNWQKLVIGGPKTYLEKIIGNMKVVNNSWRNFWFSGNLIVPSGIEQDKNKLTFIVYGDIVANNQELGVKNINTPFGNISFTYEPENHRFIGSLSMEKDLGYAYMKGNAEAVVDNEGWYFFSGGYLKVYNPESKGRSGLLIGDHSINNQMKNTFEQCSYVYQHKGSLPMTFPSSIKGFYMEGMSSIPVQSILGLPNIDIDLVVVKAKLWVNVGADMRLSTQFDKGLTIGAGMDYLFEAGFKVSQWFVVECSKLGFGALLDYGADGQVSSNLDWSANLDGSITLSGYAKVGWGVCDSDCGGKLCKEKSWSGSKTFGIKGHIGSDSKYINFYTK